MDDAALFRWLDTLAARGSYLVYIAFGTHVRVGQAIFDLLIPSILAADPQAHILIGLRCDGCAVWLIRRDDVIISSKLIEQSTQGTDRFRRAPWIPQAKVLTHPAV